MSERYQFPFNPSKKAVWVHNDEDKPLSKIPAGSYVCIVSASLGASGKIGRHTDKGMKWKPMSYIVGMAKFTPSVDGRVSILRKEGNGHYVIVKVLSFKAGQHIKVDPAEQDKPVQDKPVQDKPVQDKPVQDKPVSHANEDVATMPKKRFHHAPIQDEPAPAPASAPAPHRLRFTLGGARPVQANTPANAPDLTNPIIAQAWDAATKTFMDQLAPMAEAVKADLEKQRANLAIQQVDMERQRADLAKQRSELARRESDLKKREEVSRKRSRDEQQASDLLSVSTTKLTDAQKKQALDLFYRAI